MKKILLILLIALFPLSSLLSKPVFQIRTSYQYSYDTNVFSEPLPLSGDSAYLGYRIRNPFLKRHSNGFQAEFVFFPAEDSRAGLSVSLRGAFPFSAMEIRPDSASQDAKWEYVESDASAMQNTSWFAALGLSFRAPLFEERMEAGVAIRFALGTFDTHQRDLILALQAEYYMNWFFKRFFFVTIGTNVGCNLFKFTNYENKEYYEENYFLLTVAPYLGIGFRF